MNHIELAMASNFEICQARGTNGKASKGLATTEHPDAFMTLTGNVTEM